MELRHRASLHRLQYRGKNIVTVEEQRYSEEQRKEYNQSGRIYCRLRGMKLT